MEREPGRAKATNILRPASRAQDSSFARTNAASPTGMGANMQQQQLPVHALPGGARLISPAPGALPGFGSNQPPQAGLLRRAPSAAQFQTQPFNMSYTIPEHQQHQQYQQQHQQPPVSAGIRQRVSSYYEGMQMGDLSAVPRSVSRSGSRADLGPMAAQQQQQQLPPRSASRAGPGGMWPGQMGMNGLFGGGFGTMGIAAAPMSAGISGPMSPITPQYYSMQQQVQSPVTMNAPGSRPGSSLQHSHPSRPATSTGFRSSGAEGETPMLVNVARGGARVIGPLRTKQAPADGPSFLNPIPQSPSSALGNGFMAGRDAGAAREHIRSALSNHSLESGRSRSNSALQPTEESMEAAEARVSRKIQDLEISNTSLMAVNTQLESRVKTQREQISELKKQLQLNVPYMSDITMDGELPGEMSDETMKSVLKEDKVFERLISNLEHLIQDAKAALEYRSTVAAGKVISAAELNEDDSQLTVNSEARNQENQESAASTGNEVPSKGNDDVNLEAEASAENEDEQDTASKDKDKGVEADDSNVQDAKVQEARELVARLMVLALSSPDPSTSEKPASRIPKRAGSAATPAAARTSNAKGGLRTPVKSVSARISSFGVASTSTPVRSVAVSPTPSSKASIDSKDQTSISSEREQILDICRKLQQIL
ncbi:hypothetical protein J3F80_001622 [Coemansia sp. RSA 2526]|nr:hypothetical protein J3F80_001622 [Coemansia sp. RSA 2526]